MNSYTDIKPDIPAMVDGGESIFAMEPLVVAETAKERSELVDLAVDLAARAAGFRRSLPSGVRAALADLVRAMNCYYSNLIEGHDTHPLDIERALKNDYSEDPHRRDLQHEAQAHIAVQQWIDGGGLTGKAMTVESVQEVHRRFYDLLPDALRWVENPTTKERFQVVPGALRRGEVPRGDAAALVGTGERQARRIVAALVGKGVLTSESVRSPLRLAFPAALAPRWMPGLFPARRIT